MVTGFESFNVDLYKKAGGGSTVGIVGTQAARKQWRQV